MDVQRVVTASLHDTLSWLTTQPFHIALFAGTATPIESFLILGSPFLPALGAVLFAWAVLGFLGFLWRHIRPGVNFAKFGLRDGAYAGNEPARSPSFVR